MIFKINRAASISTGRKTRVSSFETPIRNCTTINYIQDKSNSSYLDRKQNGNSSELTRVIDRTNQRLTGYTGYCDVDNMITRRKETKPMDAMTKICLVLLDNRNKQTNEIIYHSTLRDMILNATIQHIFIFL